MPLVSYKVAEVWNGPAVNKVLEWACILL